MKVSRYQIMAFVAVGKEKSFSAAARSLGLGQSAVTQHISALEDSLGAKLFTRSRTGTRFTQMGQDLFLLADRIVVLEEQFYERANQYIELDAGSLSICVSTPRPAMSFIAAFSKKYPAVDINLQVAPWREAIDLIDQREIDIAIIMRPEETTAFHIKEIDRQPLVAILPHDHPLATQQQIHLNQFAQETFIKFSDSSYTQHAVSQLLKNSTIMPQKTLTTSSYEMMLEAVIHKMGISIALEGAQSGYEDRIKTLPIEESPEEHIYVLVCSKDKAQTLTVKRFFEVASELKNNSD
jgi:DNA-binding transcriptional LysR family regulator